jgi:hypothetical protein
VKGDGVIRLSYIPNTYFRRIKKLNIKLLILYSGREMDFIYQDNGKPLQCVQTVHRGVHSIEPQSLSLLVNGRLQQIHRCQFCNVSCIRIRRRSIEYSENTGKMFSEYFFVEHTTEHMNYSGSCAPMLKGIRRETTSTREVSDQTARV